MIQNEFSQHSLLAKSHDNISQAFLKFGLNPDVYALGG